MSTDAETQVQRNLRLMKEADDAFNRNDMETMGSFHAPDLVAYVTGSYEPTTTLAPHIQKTEEVIKAFPDARVHNDPYPIQFGEGNWATVISKLTGTFTGELLGPDGEVIPPTGKSFDVHFSTIGKWENDQLVEEWVLWDMLELLQQIGLA